MIAVNTKLPPLRVGFELSVAALNADALFKCDGPHIGCFSPSLNGRVFFLTCLLLGSPSIGAAQEDDEFRPGLIATFSDLQGGSFERIDRRVSFDWGTRPPHRCLAVGDFSACWTGRLMSETSGKYQLSVFVCGSLQIRLADKVLLDVDAEEPSWHDSQPVELSFDRYPLEIVFRKTSERAQLSLFWSGPRFQIEPIGSQRLFHDAEKTPPASFQKGESLVRALRCAACHDLPGEPEPDRGPSLEQLAGNISAQWLIDWLTDDDSHEVNSAKEVDGTGVRRMPSFGLSHEEATAIAAFLLQDEQNKHPKVSKKLPDEEVKAGEELFLTVGCLACHQLGELGESGLFAGGDLSRIADKRPTDFFTLWLSEPTKINRHHRMPVFQLTSKERERLAGYLQTLRGKKLLPKSIALPKDALTMERGMQLVADFQCASCHALSGDVEKVVKRTPIESVKWVDACTGLPDGQLARPGYRLSGQNRDAIEQFVKQVVGVKNVEKSKITGSALLVEHNCVTCHARDAWQGIGRRLPALVAAHGELASLLPAMTPPALDSVGDKLNDKSLVAAIRRESGVHRTYLRVRMPKFNLSDDELQALVKFFISVDRIPPRETQQLNRLEKNLLRHSGSRLVTSTGFGCTSCHQVGKVVPPNAPLNARGPDISMLGKRIRHEWFERFVVNPVRMIPRMEMPGVILPVRGVLDDRLDDQLDAVWHVLNEPDFQPIKADPVRIVGFDSTADNSQRAAVLTDVLRVQDKQFIKPLLIGLSNGHSVLFDLETSRLAGWWIGDVARQQVKGKSWYWEAGGTDLLGSAITGSDLVLIRGDAVGRPTVVGQFSTEIDEYRHIAGGVEFRHRLRFGEDSQSSTVHVIQTIEQRTAETDLAWRGFRRTIRWTGVPRGWRVQLQAVAKSRFVDSALLSQDRRLITLANGVVQISVVGPTDAEVNSDGAIATDEAIFCVDYLTSLPKFDVAGKEFTVDPPKPVPLEVVPGYEVTRLPISDEWMPTALAWRSDGRLIVTSLKGRVWLVWDSDGDGLEDKIQPFSDELAAPFGAAAHGKYVDVINKYALLRLFDEDGDGRAERTATLASGWGHTADYHDWAIGLPRDDEGNYYVAIPCHQDERSVAAAYLRGKVVKLSPRKPTDDDLRRFGVEPISGGFRFPIGIARNRVGALFVTDNQGNYNPFNELNHVMLGAHYGFLNAIEQKANFKPQLIPPTVDIPHPWTRSVNGICFLETPEAVKAKFGLVFGPFEGHLIGCEYDSQRLIRISLQRVGDTYQGAVYPFSLEESPSGESLLGPLICAVAPDGDLYIGCIRDSGWGGANNRGTLVRMRPSSKSVPPGIAEVRVLKDGFTIKFTAPVNREVAKDVSNYSIESFTRVSTPEYGSDDQQRRSEVISNVKVSEDARQVTLTLDMLRNDFVYEFHLKNLAGSKVFHPTDAYYTLRNVPP